MIKMSGAKKGGAGMSTELQAIMQRRLAKIDQPTEPTNESNDAMKGPDHNSDTMQREKFNNEDSGELSIRKTPEQKGRYTTPSKNTVDDRGKGVGVDETNKMTEFKRNIALFNKSKNKANTNKARTPVAERVLSPTPLSNEKPLPVSKQAPYPVSKSAFIKPYSLRPASKKLAVGAMKSPSNIVGSPSNLVGSPTQKTPKNIGSPGRRTPKHIVGSPNRKTPKNIGSPDRKTPKHIVGSPNRKVPSKFFGSPDRKVPNVVIAQPPPPPPPLPPPTVRSPNPSSSKNIEKEENKTTPSSKSNSKKHSLSSSHVQAMKLKFLLKNPKPTTPSNSNQNQNIAFSPNGSEKNIISPGNPGRDLDSFETKVAEVKEHPEIEVSAKVGKGIVVEQNTPSPNKVTVENDDNGDMNVDDDSSVEAQSDNDIEKDPKVEVNALEQTLETSNKPLFNAFAEAHVDPSFGTENNVADKSDVKETNATGNSGFPSFFENQVLSGTNNESIEAQSTQQEGIFADWTAKPSFAVEDGAIASGKGGASSEDAAGGWKWNSDPFAESSIDRSESNSAQINAGGSDEAYDGGGNDAYVPPPAFGFGSDAAFVPEEEHFEDDSDKETLLDGDIVNNANQVVIKSYTVPIASSTSNGNPSISCQNPLTENVILCRKLGKKWYIDEVDSSDRGAVTNSVEISCIDIKRELQSSLAITPCGVQDVLGIAAGVHFQNGRPRVRVAAIVKLFAFGAAQPVSVLAIWQWGYGNIRSITLQTVIPGPSCDGPHDYDPCSLSVSNGLFFVSGSVMSRPAILICKPHHQLEWVPSFLDTVNVETANGSKITHMKVCSDAKLLASSRDDGCLSVWSFADQTSSNPKVPFVKQQMKLLCVLEGISSLELTSCSLFETISIDVTEEEEGDITKNQIVDVDQRCQSFSWMPTGGASPLLLAASFHTGVAIYNVTVPFTHLPSRSEFSSDKSSPGPAATNAPEIVCISPIAGAKVNNRVHFDAYMQSYVQWIRRGDSVLPFLATCLQSKSEMKMHIGSLNVASYGQARIEKMLSIATISEATFSKKDVATHAFYGSSNICTLLAHCNGSLTSFHLSSRFGSGRCPKILSDSMNVASDVLGLTSTGFPVHSFHDVLHVHTTLTCDREKSDATTSKTSNGFPVIRHWLLRSIMGDEKVASKNDGSTSEWHNQDFPKGGASTSLICDLSCSNSSTTAFAPRKIVRDESGKFCIVLFETADTNVIDPNASGITALAVIKISSNDDGLDKFNLYSARDAAFLSNSKEVNLLALDENRKMLRKCSLASIGDDLESPECAVQIFKDGSANDKNLTVCQFFLLSKQILFLCSRNFDGKKCLFIGGSIAALDVGCGKTLVRKKTSKVWLEKGEGFLSCIELPCHLQEDKTNIAIATTSRVMIVSFATSMKILSETRATLTCKNLCPLGSSVAFVEIGIDGTNNLSYLCSHESNERGRICSISGNENLRNCQLLGLRPDRAVYLTMRYNLSAPSSTDARFRISLRGPVTKPALLLEPMIANALGQNIDDNQKQKLLHTVLERFGPKLSSTPHGENEGLGTLGAGVTAKVYNMLGPQLNAHVQKGEENKILTPWVPNIMKSTRMERTLNQPAVQNDAINKPRNLLLELTKTDITHKSMEPDFLWSKGFDETKHVWCHGPFGNSEELLLLDGIEEWAGKHRPTIIGKMGAELAAETGERTLQNILAAAAKASDGIEIKISESIDEDSTGSAIPRWVQKIGEGRNNEDNLSLYLRFSEGAEGDEKWKEDGLQDITKHRNEIELINKDAFRLEGTTSNVDEGEQGKVRPLCDLVFQRDCGADEKCGMLIEVPRGSVLDVGILHSSQNYFRQRATLEFWCFIPRISSEIVLARRSTCQLGEETSDYCCVSKKEGMLWEIVALPSGRLQFRTGHGSTISSDYDVQKDLDTTLEADPSGKQADKGLLSLPEENGYGGWNHISLSFSCRDMDSTKCNVSLRMKGYLITSSDVTLDLPQLEEDELSDFDRIDFALQRSALLFGLGATEGLRFTEVRLWACKRASEDIKMMMYEYLDIAKTKKKFSVSIRGKAFSKESKTTAGGLLMPPPIIEKPKSTSGRPLLQLPGTARGLKADDNASHGMESEADHSFADFASIDSASVGSASVASMDDGEAENNPYIKEYMDRVGSLVETENIDNNTILITPSDEASLDKAPAIAFSLKESPLISEEVRKSAAAAIIRGPPAARHFNGNRGGLRFNDDSSKSIGNICITGSEKTIIFSPEESVPAKSYPIGASGAIISDSIDGTEYLCCFLARDKRIVVFDLQSKIVVVELQMTTKLNYWRFLPPAAHGDTVVFLLITPMGGFHWMPLEESPRPKQIWRRGRDLQGKKIISYEEGGSNGRLHSENRSTLALILASPMNTPNDSIEAWILSVGGGLKPLCLSTDVLGAALFHEDSTELCAFDPYVVILSSEDTARQNVGLDIFKLTIDQDLETILTDEIITHKDIVYVPEEQKDAPTMAMGTSPSAFCLCCKNFLIVILRDQGYLVAYRFEHNQLVFVNDARLGCFVVDAAIKVQNESSGVDVVALLCDNSNVKDGRIVTVSINA